MNWITSVLYLSRHFIHKFIQSNSVTFYIQTCFSKFLDSHEIYFLLCLGCGSLGGNHRRHDNGSIHWTNSTFYGKCGAIADGWSKINSEIFHFHTRPIHVIYIVSCIGLGVRPTLQPMFSNFEEMLSRRDLYFNNGIWLGLLLKWNSKVDSPFPLWNLNSTYIKFCIFLFKNKTRIKKA